MNGTWDELVHLTAESSFAIFLFLCKLRMPHTGFFIAIFFFFINLDEINAQASFAAPEKLVFLVLTAFPTKQKINNKIKNKKLTRNHVVVGLLEITKTPKHTVPS